MDVLKLQLLVDGYIRQIEQTFISKQIIPNEINKLCHLYCQIINYVVCITEPFDYFYLTNIEEKQSVKYKIENLKNSSKKLKNLSSAGFCFAKNIKLSSNIIEQINDFNSFKKYNNNSIWDIMFKCGGDGPSDESSAVIFSHQS